MKKNIKPLDDFDKWSILNQYHHSLITLLLTT